MRFHVAIKAFKPHHETYFTRLTQVEKKEGVIKMCY